MNAAQHGQRRKGLGGSDAAAVLGLSRYQDPLGLWLEKTGQVPPRSAESPATRRGRRLEDYVLDEYAASTGTMLLRGEPLAAAAPYAHPEHPWMLANPDALVLDGDPRQRRFRGGVDAKTAAGRAAREWGRPGTDEVPQEYLLQALHYAAVFGTPWWDLELLVGGATFEFRTYRVLAPAPVLRQIIAAERAFWMCVETRTPPAGGSPTSRLAAVLARHPSHREPLRVAEDEASLRIVGELARAEAALETATAARDAAAAAVCELIGSAEGIETSLGTVTWRCNRAGRRVLKSSFVASSDGESP